MFNTMEKRCQLALESLGLCQSGSAISVKRLTGGVASDIAVISFGHKSVCVKFALEKLRVEEDWFAPVHRGKTEFNWLSAAGRVVPDAIPKLYGWSDAANGFAMEYITGPDIVNWKSALLAGRQDYGESNAVAQVLGRIHAQSTEKGFDRTMFNSAADFEQLRTDPYLRFTAQKHPAIAGKLMELANQLSESEQALVHGDISPKNILMRQSQPIILDAECATMGDPAFDVAFYLNHLLLKSVHLPKSRATFHAAMQSFWDAYAAHVTWEKTTKIQSRVVQLLPALLLARVDGKSPVEYLSVNARNSVRDMAIARIISPASTVNEFLEAIV